MPVLPPLTGPSGMTLTTARLWVRGAVRDAGGDSTVYTNTIIDRAIQVAGNHFCRETKYVKRTDAVTITAASTAFPLTTPITNGFLPERAIGVWITGEAAPLKLVNYEELNTLAADNSGTTGVPTHLAFLDTTSDAVLYPTPDDAYAAKLRYWLSFTTFTPGTASDASITFNLPDEVMQSVLTFGAPSIALAPSPEEGYAAMVSGAFADYVNKMRGAGNLGAKEIQRNAVDDSRTLRRDNQFVIETA